MRRRLDSVAPWRKIEYTSRTDVTMGLPSKTKHVLLLCIILLLPVLFIFRVGPGTASTSGVVDSYTLSSSVGPRPEDRKFTFLLKVLAYNRLPSLARCLRSLADARYSPGDVIHLHLFLDHQGVASSSLINESHRILDFVDAFSWAHGDKIVHYRSANAGLQAQWVEAWWPASEHEFAFVLEDDLEVSPLYYLFVKAAICHYYYNSSNYSPSIYGVSLQRPRFVPGKHGNKINLDSVRRLFLYQLVGTWGQILFPKPWKEFRLWYDEHKAKGLKPHLEGMVTTGWYKRLGEKIWTPWFIKFVHARSYFNIYTNFHHERALSVSHRDPGVNYGKTAGPDSELIIESPVDFNLMTMQPLSEMEWYDFCFREVVPRRIVGRLDELESVLLSVQKLQSVLLISIFDVSYAVTRNLLCHFERLNIRNFLLVGSQSDLLHDLARRGHPVIDSDMLLGHIREKESINFPDSKVPLMKDTLVKAYVTKKCVDRGYHLWILDSNILFTSLEMLDQNVKPPGDIYVAKSLPAFFARGSSSNQRIWSDKFLQRIVTFVEELPTQSQGVSFVDIISLFLKHNEVKVEKMDETNNAIIVGGANSTSSLVDSRKILYWPKVWSSDSIQMQLEYSSLWDIDADLSCKSVVCHVA